MKHRILIIVLLAAAAAAAVWFFKNRASKRNVTLTLYGNVDIREVNLGFRVPGRLAEMLKDEGDAAAKGEPLARLDGAPYEQELEHARSVLAAAKARLALLDSGSRPEEIAQARAVVREREATFVNAERLFKRLEDLLAENATSVQDRDDAEARMREAEARVATAREQLRLLEAGFRPEEIAQAKAEVEAARAAVSTAEIRLADTVLKSPFTGIILTRAQEPGAILQFGTPVLTLSLKEPIWVRAYIDEPDLGRIRPGMAVELRTDSRPERPYRGQIGFISPRAEFTPKTVETPALRTTLVYRLRIIIQDPDEQLRQGMPVTVLLPLEQG